jgi:CBS domain-containing protein
VRARNTSQSRIYAGSGSAFSTASRAWDDAQPPPRYRTIADRVLVAEIMTRDVTCGRPDLCLEALARLMTDDRIGCIPIVDERGRPQGMVTRFDIVEEIGKANGGRLALWRTAKDVMMPLVIAVHDRATVAHAATVMAREDLHHVMIVDSDGVLVGVVSSRDVVCWLVENDDRAGE